MRVLVTGFGPFGAHTSNPSDAIARALDGLELEGVAFVAESPLPVRYEEAARLAIKAAERLGADAVLALGLADTARRVRIEQRAMNLCTSRNEDGSGVTRQGLVAIEGGSAELETVIDVDVVVHALEQLGIDAERSESAGGYVCNDLYYRLLASERSDANRPILFVHLPSTAAANRDLPSALARAFVTAMHADEPASDDEHNTGEELEVSLGEGPALDIGQAFVSRAQQISGREIVRCFQHRDVVIATVAAGTGSQGATFAPDASKLLLDSLEDAFRRTTGPVEVRLHAAVLRAAARFRDRGGAPARERSRPEPRAFATVLAVACDGESYFAEWVGGHTLHLVSAERAICQVPGENGAELDRRRIEPAHDLVTSSLVSFGQLAPGEHLVLSSATLAPRVDARMLTTLVKETASADTLAALIINRAGQDVPYASAAVLRSTR